MFNPFSDIDECSILTNPCGINAVCQNTDPGFECICPQGFKARQSAYVACEQVIILAVSL